ncbi:hypothetical protein GIB67_027076 [Kingdonia uniflora]|uniref:Retrotransposon Copia-like N-terminal domain-containing protein n=1 Tax=Kingdonia uniflora TaxID=39325 RepID=A0A7J7P1S7_9MAGN|nr:hypothetical protein GIB67_027076 [Kingdonia uniflora]
MLSIMESQLIDDHVNEEPPKDEAIDATSYQSWKKDNALIKSWIRGSLTEEVLHLITGLSTAREFKGICDELAAMQKPMSDDDRVNWLANGLGPKYFNFCDAKLSKPPTPTYSCNNLKPN